MKLNIRGHHLLCIQGFQGYGYNEEFRKNMDYIVKILKKDEDIEIHIINDVDDLCRFCPNKNDSICLNEIENKKIKKMDNVIISKLNQQNYSSFKEVVFEIKTKFTNHELINLCQTCKWYNKCLLYKDID